MGTPSDVPGQPRAEQAYYGPVSTPSVDAAEVPHPGASISYSGRMRRPIPDHRHRGMLYPDMPRCRNTARVLQARKSRMRKRAKELAVSATTGVWCDNSTARGIDVGRRAGAVPGPAFIQTNVWSSSCEY